MLIGFKPTLNLCPAIFYVCAVISANAFFILMNCKWDKAITNSYHKRLAYLEDKEIITLTDYAKREKISTPIRLTKPTAKPLKPF